jgi:hypothetical protein
MRKENFRQLYEAFASAVAFVAVEDANGAQSIGSAFHVGEGVFVTARLGRKQEDYFGRNHRKHNPSHSRRKWGARGRASARGKVARRPLFHPNENVDVAALVVDGIDAPVIPLGGHLDDWLGTELVLCPTLVFGYPPIPFAKEPILVAATGEVNAIVDKYTGGHPHFILSTMARGGFSGGLAITDFGCALGLITESLGDADKPAELGYLSVLSIEPIYVCLAHHNIMPAAVHAEWGEGDYGKSLWKPEHFPVASDEAEESRN